jgi:hypothetical protein
MFQFEKGILLGEFQVGTSMVSVAVSIGGLIDPQRGCCHGCRGYLRNPQGAVVTADEHTESLSTTTPDLAMEGFSLVES